jgi:hypothetical protein
VALVLFVKYGEDGPTTFHPVKEELPDLSSPHMWRPLGALMADLPGNVTVWHSKVHVGKRTSRTSRITISRDLYGSETKLDEVDVLVEGVKGRRG